MFRFRQMLRELVPSDLVKIQGSSDWKRSINASYNQDAGMTPEDAKVTFLKIVYRYKELKYENSNSMWFHRTNTLILR